MRGIIARSQFPNHCFAVALVAHFTDYPKSVSGCSTTPYQIFFLVRNEEVAGSIPVSSTKNTALTRRHGHVVQLTIRAAFLRESSPENPREQRKNSDQIPAESPKGPVSARVDEVEMKVVSRHIDF